MFAQQFHSLTLPTVIVARPSDVPKKSVIRNPLTPFYEIIADKSSKDEQHKDLFEYNWYHGKITEEEAEAALSVDKDVFLVRQRENSLVLSRRERLEIT